MFQLKKNLTHAHKKVTISIVQIWTLHSIFLRKSSRVSTPSSKLDLFGGINIYKKKKKKAFQTLSAIAARNASNSGDPSRFWNISASVLWSFRPNLLNAHQKRKQQKNKTNILTQRQSENNLCFLNAEFPTPTSFERRVFFPRWFPPIFEAKPFQFAFEFASQSQTVEYQFSDPNQAFESHYCTTVIQRRSSFQDRQLQEPWHNKKKKKSETSFNQEKILVPWE